MADSRLNDPAQLALDLGPIPTVPRSHRVWTPVELFADTTDHDDTDRRPPRLYRLDTARNPARHAWTDKWRTVETIHTTLI